MRQHSGHLPRRLNLDAPRHPVRVGAPHKVGVRLPGLVQVIGLTAFAAQEGEVSGAADGSSDHRRITAAKIVFIPFLEALPYMKDDVAGEAKLLYVAMTRAMDRLVLTHHGDSRFVAEISEALAA